MDTALKTAVDAAKNAFACGNFAVANEMLSSLLIQAPGNYELLHLAGRLALQAKNAARATGYLKAAISRATMPEELGRIWYDLGVALSGVGEHAQAADAFGNAAQTCPFDPMDMLIWANTLMAAKRYDEAESVLQKAIAQFPDDPNIHVLLGNVLILQNRQSQAVSLYERVLQDNPDSALAHYNLSTALNMLGRIDDAEQEVIHALQLDPELTGYYNLSNLHKFSEDDPLFAQLRRRAQQTLNDTARIDVDFALAKAYDDIGKFEDAFTTLQNANRRKRRSIKYDLVDDATRFRRIASLFTPDFLGRFKNKVRCTLKPVFIVGMPRTGSTLLEQMLASHPAISAGGEMPHTTQILKELDAAWTAYDPNQPANSEAVINDLQICANRYMDLTSALHIDTEFFTDKFLGNFELIGLLCLMFPEAKFVHCKRDPVDTCLSCYRRLFLSVPYSYDLRELGRYYYLYAQLMHHWHTALPGQILDIHYEKLIEAPQLELERVLEVCRLNYDPSCLTFQTNQNVVTTASAAQVRKPLYKTSLQHWKNYEPYLAPLLEALGITV
jgi:Flp pilus assembly protein TadD